MSDRGQGARPTAADLRWLEAAKELTPDKSLARSASNARFLVGTISVVAAVLTAFGVLGSGKLDGSPWLLAFAGLTTILAALSVVFALWALLSRHERVRVGNIDEVKTWYDRELQRKAKASVAGLLLIAALTSAVGTALGQIWATMTATPMNETTLSVVAGKDGYTVGIVGAVASVPVGGHIEIRVRSDGITSIQVSALAKAGRTATVDSAAVVPSRPALVVVDIIVRNAQGRVVARFSDRLSTSS